MGSGEDNAHSDGPKDVQQKFDFPILPEIDFDEEKIIAPWMSKGTSMIISPRLKLHNEIIEFCSMIKPTQHNMDIRKKAL